MDALADFWQFVTVADHWWGNRGIVVRTWAHVRLSLVATVLAVAIAAPPALWFGHRRIGGSLVVGLVNVARAIPSVAVIALVLPFSLRYGFGLGFWPTCVALVMLGIPPVFANTFTGVVQTDPGVVEAARGMGMRGGEVLRGIELPLAVPLIVTGVRIAAVQIVATATLGALVGFQGLGSFLIEGLAQGSRGNDRLLTGAVAVALLALLTEATFSLLERLASPWRRGVPRPRWAEQPRDADPPPAAERDDPATALPTGALARQTPVSPSEER